MSNIETERERLPVMLFIRGEQYFDDVDPDATELMTEGILERTAGGLRLTYQETALTGMEGTTTTFEVSGSQVILTRTGSVNSQMVFQKGRQHSSLYETPWGTIVPNGSFEQLQIGRSVQKSTRTANALKNMFLGLFIENTPDCCSIQ